MANILILSVKVPFSFGGHEVLVGSLMRELRARDHNVDIAELPLKIPPKENLITQIGMWRSLDLTSFGGTQVDLAIATKFPSYYAKLPLKSLWLVHQHRPVYDLHSGPFSDFTDSPEDEAIRRMISEADTLEISKCKKIATISKNVASRLKSFNGVDAEVLYPPLPLGNRYQVKPSENYILAVGRLCGIKRFDMMLKALPIVHHFIKLKIVGAPDEPGILDYFKNEIDKHHLWDRVELLGRVSDDELLELYAKALAVYYAPYNEDFGYVTLEGMASGKPIITATDSGGVLEFVSHDQTGIIVTPNIDALGHSINELVSDSARLSRLGQNARLFMEREGFLESGWDRVISSLLSPLASTND